eukprot:CAMPEP_0184106670 /NCGR_PEP_ID=MMETSP0974-20121125/15494_1 /TAXON_ID=483370 /ORGANISM="non described non described, Strain CCMP2097" /LENGTH=86 /DNA_ID=CAMNT_0026409689 /DNA_START=347 /DNA_END=607 /DNA_ORIENTATION=-
MHRSVQVFKRKRLAANASLAGVDVEERRRNAEKVAHAAWLGVYADLYLVAPARQERRAHERRALRCAAAVGVAAHRAAAVVELEEL